MEIVPFTSTPALYQVGQRVRVISERGERFGKITAGPSQRPTDFGKRNAPWGYFVSDEDTGLISPVMTPNLGPVLADPAELQPSEPVAIVPVGRLQQLQVWITKPETIRMLLKKAGGALAMAALKWLYSFFMNDE
jgi:hypothetical protein